MVDILTRVVTTVLRATRATSRAHPGQIIASNASEQLQVPRDVIERAHRRRAQPAHSAAARGDLRAPRVGYERVNDARGLGGARNGGQLVLGVALDAHLRACGEGVGARSPGASRPRTLAVAFVSSQASSRCGASSAAVCAQWTAA